MLIGSADLMERNLDRRVETLCFVRDQTIRDRLRDEVLGTLMADNDRAMELDSDGSYHAVAATPQTPLVSAQEELLRLHTERD